MHWSREATVAKVQWSEHGRGEMGSVPYSSVFWVLGLVLLVPEMLQDRF